jgi:tRNA uridine 5-carboxymethylaminomethyl modification enzyme
MVRSYHAGKYDCIVVGAGHAGCEAALASARMGADTLILSINLDSIAMMPCNPSIGGTGKGHLVREIDALGGEMGLNIDKSLVQSKMLNRSKGPAVHSLRAQADKNKYHIEMKKVLENTDNLKIRQAEVVKIDVEDGKVKGVLTATGAYYEAPAVILATGTYLASKIFIGDAILSSGPNGLAASYELADQLKDLKIEMRRFKTGTPARVDSRTLNYDRMEIQWGDSDYEPFSFMNDHVDFKELPCWLTYTNPTTHEIIINNLDKSGLYTGTIEGTGPRYCPSIETKIERFQDKQRHQLFIEPEGYDTNEMYVQGMSTSMAEDVQLSFMRTIPGMEACEIMRPAYAIEYDCINPLHLKLSLEFQDVEGLFSAGQFNGSSGYEEAAAQGLIAGINAVQKLRGCDPFILDRSEAYIGVLIDDLVTKGTDEPYRMMTSRAEYRLLLRQDNADIRLTEKAYHLGLASQERFNKLQDKLKMIDEEMKRVSSVNLNLDEVNPILEKLGTPPVAQNTKLIDLLKRSEVSYAALTSIDHTRPDYITKDVLKQVEIMIKYDGYIKKQLQQVEKYKSLENKKLPLDIDYSTIDSLRLEARQKLNEIKPESIGQASRISGVSPADVSVLLVYLEQMRRRRSGSE